MQRPLHRVSFPQVLLILLLPFGFLFVGCAGLQKPPAISPEDRVMLTEPLEMDVFSARGFLGGSDYERYHFKDDALWRECGNIVTEKEHRRTNDDSSLNKLEGDEVFKENRDLLLETRRVEKISTNANVLLRKKIQEFFYAFSSQTKSAPPPGSVASLAGPGLFEISVSFGEKQKHFITSIDAVSEPGSSPTLKAAYNLFSVLRGIGPVICNQTTFFGIPREKNVS